MRLLLCLKTLRHSLLRSIFKRIRPGTTEKLNAEEAKALLKERGISVMNVPHGYMVKVSKREGSPSRRIDLDEMNAILALGMIRLLAVEDTVGDILIEVLNRLMPEHQR